MSPCHQVGVSWYGKERENLMWLGKGFFFCRSNNINLRQKPKNNILRGCFCREPEGAPGRESDWLERASGLERRCRPERDGNHCSTAIIVL